LRVLHGVPLILLCQEYTAAWVDFYGVWHPNQPGTNNAELFFLLDIPVSLGADTILLPLTIYEQIKYGNCGDQIQQSEKNTVVN
jgi:hypothetical protein